MYNVQTCSKWICTLPSENSVCILCFWTVLGYNKCHGIRYQGDGFAKYGYEKGNMSDRLWGLI